MGVASHQGVRESLMQGEGKQVSQRTKEKGSRVMRETNTILELIHERGKKGLPLERVYRLIYHPSLYVTGYGKIYGNKGA